MIINLIAADRGAWDALMTGPLHDERYRFWCPAEVDQKLIDECGRPYLISLLGVPDWQFHIYPPRQGVKG